MLTLHARRGTQLLVVVLLLVSVLLEQAIAGCCSWLGELGGVRPMIVFLDIPLAAPVTIDWLPVGFLLLLFYGLIGGGDPDDKPKGEIRRKGWAILGRWWLLLIFLLTGGGLFGLICDFLPKAIRNGLDSFGIRADLILPYPSGDTIHLHGSMIMMAFLIPGWRILINTASPRPSTVPPVLALAERQPAGLPSAISASAALTSATRAPAEPTVSRHRMPVVAGASTPDRVRMVMRIPEPLELRSSPGRPCVYVSMPNGFERKRNSYPCVVEGGIQPAGPPAEKIRIDSR